MIRSHHYPLESRGGNGPPKGTPQQRCVTWQTPTVNGASSSTGGIPSSLSCHRWLTASNSRPYPHDRRLRWCNRCMCRERAHRLASSSTSTVDASTATPNDASDDAAAAATAASIMMDLAHTEDATMHDSVAASVSPTPCDTSSHRDFGAARTHLLSHRWTIVRHNSLKFRHIVSQWWQCSLSTLAAVSGPQWENLHIEGDGLQAQQCEASSIPHSAGMITETIAALHELLRSLHIDRIVEKQCVVLKLIRSPPGAARQRLHYDVPTHLVLRDKHRRKIPGTSKSAHCVSVLVHLNPGTSAGTHLPRLSHVDMLQLIQAETSGSLACGESMYVSSDMEQSDVSVFYDDVPHYGPAHPISSTTVADKNDVRTWRWVLFAMFSPERGARQDEQQTFLSCK